MLEIDLYNSEGEVVGKTELPKEIFGQKPDGVVLHEVVRAYLSNQRSGSASTKRRGEVSGSGRKLWRQKGTGRARVGDARSPTRRKGGIVFGPKPRDYKIQLPTKLKKKGVIMALSNAAFMNSIILLDSFNLNGPKTAEMVKILNRLGVKKGLIILGKIDQTVSLASRNIKGVELVSAANLNAYQVLKHDKLIITQEGLTQLKERFLKSA